MTTITKKDFKEYEEIQLSGKVNMFYINHISDLTGLTNDQIFEIQRNYAEFEDKWGIKR